MAVECISKWYHKRLAAQKFSFSSFPSLKEAMAERAFASRFRASPRDLTALVVFPGLSAGQQRQRANGQHIRWQARMSPDVSAKERPRIEIDQ